VAWMTPGWRSALKHTAAEADRLGLEMAIASSGGWSETGGPSVRPAEAMKKMVWSETAVRGPASFAGMLSHPPSVNGHFQSIEQERRRPGSTAVPSYYADARVIAYRVPRSEAQRSLTPPRAAYARVTSSVGPIDSAVLSDGDLTRAIRVALPEGGTPAWLQYEYDRPQQVRALTLAAKPAGHSLGASRPPRHFQA